MTPLSKNPIIGKTTGIAGRSIYQISFDGTNWSDEDGIHDQESKDAPAMAALSNAMYLAHRGKTDGIAGNSIYWSVNTTGEHGDWSKNKEVEKPCQKAESQHRPGGGAWKNNFVIVHNGNTSEKLHRRHRLFGIFR